MGDHRPKSHLDLPPDWRELYEERAAIREFDGHQDRPSAERDALREIHQLMGLVPRETQLGLGW